jgi:hypothetical protein
MAPGEGEAVDDRIDRLESTVQDLQRTVRALETRLEALASRGVLLGHAAENGSEDGAGARAAARARDPHDPVVLLTLAGRLFLVLAGGFFLRAMTDTGVMVPPLGLSVGFAYAMVWLGLADRSGGRGDVAGALFHAMGAALIAYPLLVEAATRFHVLTATGSALAVAALTVAMLFVAWHRRLRGVGWITVCGVLPTSAALLMQTGVVAPFALLLIAFGIATLWFGYALDWWGPRWPAALAADVAVVGVTLRVLAPVPQETPQLAILMQLLLLGSYVASIAVRTLVRGRNVVLFEVAQTAAVLVVGFGGALYLTRVTGILPETIGVLSLLSGVASYGVAVFFLDRRKDNGPNVYYYTTLAFVHVVAGCALILPEPWLGIVFSVLAACAAWLWARAGRSFTLVHAAAYLLAAGIVSGTIAYGAGLLVRVPDGPWVRPSAVMTVVLAAAVLAATFSGARRNPSWDVVASGLRVLIVLVLLGAGAACVVGYAAPATGLDGSGRPTPGVVATVTTSALALATLVVAWLGRQARYREWSWLVYPLLVAIGIRMALQDFKLSRPSTLFIAMALYGAALIVAPRLRRAATTLGNEAGA